MPLGLISGINSFRHPDARARHGIPCAFEPEFARSVVDVSHVKMAAERLRVVTLRDDSILRISEPNSLRSSTHFQQK
ncbi:MAG: hypothetical protein ACLQIB_04550 [Isosphaeraceae bacterium]